MKRWKDKVGIFSSGTANIAKVENYPVWHVQIVPKILPKLFYFCLANLVIFPRVSVFKAFPVILILEPIDGKLISNSPLNQRFYSQIPSYILREIIDSYRSMCYKAELTNLQKLG